MKNKAVVVFPPHGTPALRLNRGEVTVRTLSAKYLTDLYNHWQVKGEEALNAYAERYPDRYVENMSSLVRIIRVEQDVKHSLATPKTVDEALARLEERVGPKGRQRFEKFLRDIAKDKERERQQGEIIDVDPEPESDVP